MKRLVLSFLLLFVAQTPNFAQDDSNTQNDYIIETYITNDSPYVGEQVSYVLRYYAYIQSDDVFDELPDFEGFWLTEVRETTDGWVETILERQYIVKEVFAEISALDAGEITIAPSYLEIPETVFRESARLESESITVNVQPLPESAPASFRGAVGTFNARIEVDPLQVTLGEPVTLTMTIDGTGNLEQLSAPFLPETPDWRVYSNPSRYVVSSIGGLRFGQKVFEWLLIPERAGTQVYPPIIFTYFDPQLEEFVTTEIEEFSISVLPGEGSLMELPSFALDNDGAAILPMRNVNVNQTRGESELAIPWLAWLIMPGVLLSVVGYSVSVKLRTSWRKTYLQSHAFQHAKRVLGQLHKKGHVTIGEEVQKIIYMYFSDRFATKYTLVDHETVEKLINEHSEDLMLVEQLDQLFELAEAVQFAPETDPQLTDQLFRSAGSTLKLIDDRLQ